MNTNMIDTSNMNHMNRSSQTYFVKNLSETFNKLIKNGSTDQHWDASTSTSIPNNDTQTFIIYNKSYTYSLFYHHKMLVMMVS